MQIITSAIQGFRLGFEPKHRFYSLGLTFFYSILYFIHLSIIASVTIKVMNYFGAFDLINEPMDSIGLEIVKLIILGLALIGYLLILFFVCMVFSNFYLSFLNRSYAKSILDDTSSSLADFKVLFKREMTKLAYTMGMLIFSIVIFMCLFFIPILNFLAPVSMFVLFSFLTAVYYLDYAVLELDFKGVINLAMKNKREVVKLGAVLSLLNIIFGLNAFMNAISIGICSKHYKRMLSSHEE